MGFFSEYDINTNPGTANSVSTAAFRFVASLLPGIIQYYDNKGQRVKVESFSDAFYKPDGLYEAGMLDHIFRGMIKSHTQVMIKRSFRLALTMCFRFQPEQNPIEVSYFF